MDRDSLQRNAIHKYVLMKRSIIKVLAKIHVTCTCFVKWLLKVHCTTFWCHEFHFATRCIKCLRMSVKEITSMDSSVLHLSHATHDHTSKIVPESLKQFTEDIQGARLFRPVSKPDPHFVG